MSRHGGTKARRHGGTGTERPILFSGPMVRAILEDRKTQTRRCIKPQPIYTPPCGSYESGHHWWPVADEDCFRMKWGEKGDSVAMRAAWADFCPYGLPSDWLWVRETWLHEDNSCDDERCGNPDHIWYRATEEHPEMFPRWRPSIFMPRWASRTRLQISEVRVERVREIRDADIRAEGVDCVEHDCPGGLRKGFRVLWDSLNAKRGFGWAANPWVWVITFDPLDRCGIIVN